MPRASERLNKDNSLKKNTPVLAQRWAVWSILYNIDMVIIKQVINYIAKQFAHVCSTSFEYGVFPDNMRVAKVVPLFKAGDRSVFSNYRPISQLSPFSKILEQLINERLDKFIDKFQLLNN